MKAMHKIGITEKSSVNILSSNCPEWFISFMGAVCYNCIGTGVYTTNSADACVYQAQHSDAELIVVDSL